MIHTWLNNNFIYYKIYKLYKLINPILRYKKNYTRPNQNPMYDRNTKRLDKKIIKKNYGAFLNYTYYFKSYLSFDKKISFFLLSFNDNVSRFNLFFLNAILLKWDMLFFSNRLYIDDLTSYNWFFIKKLKFTYIFNFFLNFSMFMRVNIMLRADLFLNKMFYIIDTLYNYKIIVFLWKIQKITIGSPYNEIINNLLFFPVSVPSSISSSNIVFTIDIFFFNYIIFLKKSSRIIK